MQELWLVTMNMREEVYNVYYSEERANRAVNLMRMRLGEEGAKHFEPHVIRKLAEGEAFGEDVSVPGKRQYEEVILEPSLGS